MMRARYPVIVEVAAPTSSLLLVLGHGADSEAKRMAVERNLAESGLAIEVHSRLEISAVADPSRIVIIDVASTDARTLVESGWLAAKGGRVAFIIEGPHEAPDPNTFVSVLHHGDPHSFGEAVTRSLSALGFASKESTGKAKDSSGTDGGYRAPQVCDLVGITYRQLDYWARTGLLAPSLSAGTSGRLYSFNDIVQLRVIKALLDAGMSLKKIRSSIQVLREELAKGTQISDLILLSDGSSILAATSPEEVVDMFHHGQGIFGIALGPIQDDLAAAISDSPSDLESWGSP